MAQDKGGPSKGGFLNNILSSYTDMYLCGEINGTVCVYTQGIIQENNKLCWKPPLLGPPLSLPESQITCSSNTPRCVPVHISEISETYKVVDAGSSNTPRCVPFQISQISEISYKHARF